jgi:phospholipase/carboxylesterase
MQEALIIQQPSAAATGASPELLLLFHGVGSSAEDLLPLGEAIASHRPGAWVVSVRSPEPSDLGQGWQWFSVKGITEANRPARVQAALPGFLKTVALWQGRASTDSSATTLIGFSQGAIMALEATQSAPSPAGRVIAIAGRLARDPSVAPVRTSVHLLHGDGDGVMPVALALDAAKRLQELGAAVTLDRFARLGHGIDARVVDVIVKRLSESTRSATA